MNRERYTMQTLIKVMAIWMLDWEIQSKQSYQEVKKGICTKGDRPYSVP